MTYNKTIEAFREILEERIEQLEYEIYCLEPQKKDKQTYKKWSGLRRLLTRNKEFLSAVIMHESMTPGDFRQRLMQ